MSIVALCETSDEIHVPSHSSQAFLHLATAHLLWAELGTLQNAHVGAQPLVPQNGTMWPKESHSLVNLCFLGLPVDCENRRCSWALSRR